MSLRLFFFVAVLATLALASVCDAFSPVRRTTSTSNSNRVVIQSSSSPENPCWQDLYDEDCTMESLFAANYKAGEWIKRLPCAQGMEDCDFPDEEFIPEIRPEANYEEIDVMSFLNIHRPEPVKKKAE